MLDGPLVFVDIDTQRDFMEATGALYVAGAEAIVANLGRLTDFARSQGIPILATACAHAPDDPELLQFGPHCLVGTAGQERIAATRGPETTIVGPLDDFQGSIPPHLTIEKREVDVFRHPRAEAIVSIYGRESPIFVVYGVATDYCVKAAVDGLLDRSYRVAVVVDAVRAIDPAAEADLFADWIRRGALLTITEAVSGKAFAG